MFQCRFLFHSKEPKSDTNIQTKGSNENYTFDLNNMFDIQCVMLSRRWTHITVLLNAFYLNIELEIFEEYTSVWKPKDILCSLHSTSWFWLQQSNSEPLAFPLIFLIFFSTPFLDFIQKRSVPYTLERQ